MRIMINGAGGMLGQAIYEVFSHQADCFFTDRDVNETWIKHLDFRNWHDYERLATQFRPRIILHLGAYTDLEFCEKNERDAYLTNAISVEHSILIANKLGARLIYVSTAGIFDGRKDFYDELDVPNPLGVYARTKYWGELMVSKHSPNSLIVRAGWMMGGGVTKDKKFVKKIIDQILDGKKLIRVVDDKLGTPTYTFDFARNLWTLLQGERFGLFNMVASGFTSRIEVAQAICEELGADIEIKAVSSGDFPEYFAPRPSCERLLNRRLELYGLNEMRDWRDSLSDYLKNRFFKKT